MKRNMNFKEKIIHINGIKITNDFKNESGSFLIFWDFLKCNTKV